MVKGEFISNKTYGDANVPKKFPLPCVSIIKLGIKYIFLYNGKKDFFNEDNGHCFKRMVTSTRKELQEIQAAIKSL